MGYWADISKRAWRESWADVRWDNRGRVMIALIPIIGTAIAGWCVLGDAASGAVRVLATVGLTFLMGMALYAWRMLSLPPKLHAEMTASLAEAGAKLRAPKPIDMAKVSGLHTLWIQKCLHLRGGRQLAVTPHMQREWARQLIEDISVIHGPDRANALRRHFQTALDPLSSMQQLDEMMKILGRADLPTWQKELQPEFISAEYGDVAAYVDARLLQLRSEGPSFGV